MQKRILNFGNYLAPLSGSPNLPAFVSLVVSKRPPHFRPQLSGELKGDPVVAYVGSFPTLTGWNGRWIASCECGGCEYVDLEDPRFMCCSCFNEDNGHSWRPVEIPEEDFRTRLEELLLARPGRNQNWIPGESIEDIESENEVHL